MLDLTLLAYIFYFEMLNEDTTMMFKCISWMDVVVLYCRRTGSV